VFEAEILVTGAGGFIGNAVARSFRSQSGLAVRGATRDGRPVADGVAPCRLDVRDPTQLAAALDGVDAIVHCAVGDRDTTVDGTRLLLQAARAARIRRVVHFSSIAVYGARTGAVDETAPLESQAGDSYAHWKVAAEAACREAAVAGIDVVILRPAIVYGPGSLMWILRPAQRLLSGRWRGLGDAGRGTCNAVHVDDVASACLAALRAPANTGNGAAFNIAGPDTIDWAGWYARLAAALGCPALRDLSPAGWRRRMQAALPLKALARLLPGAERLFRSRLLAAPAQSELTLFALAATYPTQKAAAQLGWQPRIGLDEGLGDSVAWLRAQGLVQGLAH
jgi:nucleoside-diphosphate-sugar epimerase